MHRQTAAPGLTGTDPRVRGQNLCCKDHGETMKETGNRIGK